MFALEFIRPGGDAVHVYEGFAMIVVSTFEFLGGFERPGQAAAAFASTRGSVNDFLGIFPPLDRRIVV